MTLNGQNVSLAEIKSFYGAHHKNFKEDRPKRSAAKCRSMILVSRNIRYLLIFAGVPREGASNDSGDCGIVEERNFNRLLLAICSETLHRICRIWSLYSIGAVPRRWHFGDLQINDLG